MVVNHTHTGLIFFFFFTGFTVLPSSQLLGVRWSYIHLEGTAWIHKNLKFWFCWAEAKGGETSEVIKRGRKKSGQKFLQPEMHTQRQL